MSETNFTPGPWHVRGKQVRYRLPGFTTTELLADCDTEADAQLIAVAPELLEALTELMAAFGGVQTHAQQAKWDKAKAAIAKAQGRQIDAASK